MSEVLRKDILDLFGGDLHDKHRLLYPVDDSESVESRVVARFNTLRDRGGVTLVDGAFDVPHNNHEWYLRHCKMIGVFAAFKARYGDDATFEEMAARLPSQPEILDTVSLAVTVDADDKVAYKKSGLDHKGGVQRPIYPWIARAGRLAGYHFSLNGRLHQTVDLVTVEGDEQHKDTPLESSLALASFLKSEKLLDTFIVFGEHDATVREAHDLQLDPIVVSDDGKDDELNPQTGERWSSSALIRRAQGGAVPVPITRPEGL